MQVCKRGIPCILCVSLHFSSQRFSPRQLLLLTNIPFPVPSLWSGITQLLFPSVKKKRQHVLCCIRHKDDLPRSPAVISKYAIAAFFQTREAFGAKGTAVLLGGLYLQVTGLSLGVCDHFKRLICHHRIQSPLPRGSRHYVIYGCLSKIFAAVRLSTRCSSIRNLVTSQTSPS